MRHILFCSCNEGMGRMQPLQSRWSLLSTAALRNLKLLAGSGCLEFQKGNGRKGFLKQPCPTSLVWHCVTFSEHRQLKGWQPHLQPTVAKSSISTSVHWFAAVTKHNWEHNHCMGRTAESLADQLLDHAQQAFADVQIETMHCRNFWNVQWAKEHHVEWS